MLCSLCSVLVIALYCLFWHCGSVYEVVYPDSERLASSARSHFNITVLEAVIGYIPVEVDIVVLDTVPLGAWKGCFSADYFIKSKWDYPVCYFSWEALSVGLKIVSWEHYFGTNTLCSFTPGDLMEEGHLSAHCSIQLCLYVLLIQVEILQVLFVKIFYICDSWN